MKEQICENIEQIKAELYDVSQFIGDNPELGHEEYKASKALTELLAKYNFHVTLGTTGLPTAFEAVYESSKPGPSIALMAEYDALPELGHACGHNLIGTTAAAAAIAVSKVLDSIGGKVYVYGTPAEETKGGKVTMVEQGVFNDLDAAMMVHPYYRYEKSGTSLAMDAIQFEFFGKSAHAAAAPHEGINALDAVIQTFNSINALRQHVTEDVRIHGVIPEGGKAANIVPDYAVAQFYVRAAHREYLQHLIERVKACATGAAEATGARLNISFYEFSYDDMRTNEALSSIFNDNLLSLGVNSRDIHEPEIGGSLDMGNVSHVVPSIHPYIKICNEPYACHTEGFREAALSRQGFEGMMIGAKNLALTAYDLFTQPDLLAEVKKEFVARKNLK